MPPISATTNSKSPYASSSTSASKPVSEAKRVASSRDAKLPSAGDVPFKSKATRWEQRTRDRAAKAGMRALEQELKDDKESARAAHVTRIKERRQKAANKARIEELAKKMSGKRLERQKRRMGLTKKIAH